MLFFSSIQPISVSTLHVVSGSCFFIWSGPLSVALSSYYCPYPCIIFFSCSKPVLHCRIYGTQGFKFEKRMLCLCIACVCCKSSILALKHIVVVVFSTGVFMCFCHSGCWSPHFPQHHKIATPTILPHDKQSGYLREDCWFGVTLRQCCVFCACP